MELLKIDNYVFTLDDGSKTINVWVKEIHPDNLADRYLANSPKKAKAIFQQLREYKPEPLPYNLDTYCDCTKKPCNPNSWFCHRQFVAIRYLKGHPGTNTLNKGCKDLRTNNSKSTSEVTAPGDGDGGNPCKPLNPPIKSPAPRPQNSLNNRQEKPQMPDANMSVQQVPENPR